MCTVRKYSRLVLFAVIVGGANVLFAMYYTVAVPSERRGGHVIGTASGALFAALLVMFIICGYDRRRLLSWVVWIAAVATNVSAGFMLILLIATRDFAVLLVDEYIYYLLGVFAVIFNLLICEFFVRPSCVRDRRGDHLRAAYAKSPRLMTKITCWLIDYLYIFLLTLFLGVFMLSVTGDVAGLEHPILICSMFIAIWMINLMERNAMHRSSCTVCTSGPPGG